MRILYICTYYHRAMVFRDSMDCLEKRGHSVIAFNAVKKGARIDDKYRAIMDEKVIHRECFSDYDRFFFNIKQQKIIRAIESSVRLTDFDLIHSHMLFNGGWAAYRLNRKYGIPYVVSVRNTDMNVFLKIPLFRTIARIITDNASGVLFLSEAYREKFLDTCYKGDLRDPILRKSDVIPNGLEPFWLGNVGCPREKTHSPLRLLCVGKIDRNKNMATVIQAMGKLNAEGTAAELTVIGQVVDPGVKSLLDSSEHVRVIPYLTKEELIRYYREADVFVMPSFWESFGRVYAEAMTQGVPVIYTRGQGFDGTFPEGTVGYSVKADDAGEVADAIRKVADDFPGISARCVENCRLFDWTEISERLERLYCAAVDRRGL